MRCNNCGWDDQNPNSTVCVKCGHTLQTGGGQAAYGQPYAPVNQAPNYRPNYGGGEPQPRPTVVGSAFNEPVAPKPTVVNPMGAMEPQPRPTVVYGSTGSNGPDNLKATVAQTPSACPQCNYPLMPGAQVCPNCGQPLAAVPAPQQQAPAPQQQAPAPQQQAQPVQPAAPQQQKPVQSQTLSDLGIDEKVTCPECGTVSTAEFTFCPKCATRLPKPTIQFNRRKVAAAQAPEPPKPKCSLTLIPEDDEQGTEALRHDYEGASVILNRENTEPDNRTITSKEQAELTCEDGKWYVVNHSEMQSTFIEVSRKMELQPGDILLLGDRRFKFEPQES